MLDNVAGRRRFQRHAALRIASRLHLGDLRVHRTDVLDRVASTPLGLGPRSVLLFAEATVERLFLLQRIAALPVAKLVERRKSSVIRIRAAILPKWHFQ
jgi:hypothetical protein